MGRRTVDRRSVGHRRRRGIGCASVAARSGGGDDPTFRAGSVDSVGARLGATAAAAGITAAETGGREDSEGKNTTSDRTLHGRHPSRQSPGGVIRCNRSLPGSRRGPGLTAQQSARVWPRNFSIVSLRAGQASTDRETTEEEEKDLVMCLNPSAFAFPSQSFAPL